MNIFKVLNNLGIQSTAFGFIGEFIGDLIKKDLAKNLMTWVSYMLPFVISGGILLALAFLFDKLSGIDGGQSLGSTTYLAQLFMTIGIPYTCDPLRMIPICIIGSAIAGGLTMVFLVTLPAPHGG